MLIKRFQKDMANKKLVIYHGNCADGFSGAWCFWKLFGNDAEYFPGVYGKEPPDVTDREVFLVDFSYKRSIIEEMLKKASLMIILDHHISAINDLKDLKADNLDTVFDVNRSGATIAWDYLFPYEPRPALLNHVEDRDLWRFKLDHTREVQAAMFSFEYSFEKWDQLMQLDITNNVQGYLNLIMQGEAIERKHHKDVRELLKSCTRIMNISGVDVPVASLPYTMASDAGVILAEGHPFAATYYDTKDYRAFSLRSTTGIGLDVSKIAEYYGGGGHAHASGFRVNREHRLATS
jgi:oligoribonuclease NrnB/cAMP/cGMP phosphodiesterase (DHH superfamily)